MAGSRSPRAGQDLSEAEAERERRVRSGLCFPSVRHALRFYFERGQSMQAPLGMHPRGQIAPDGSVVYVDVDGGRGGDIHEVLSTLQTIHDAMVELRLSSPVQFELLVRHVRDGDTYAALGKAANCAASTVSADLGKAESFLLGWLRRSEVVIPGRADAA
jgi:hypothetical protein